MGWSPDVIWNTPVPQIFLALEGKYDFVLKTNPFGGGKDTAKPLSEDEKAKRLAANKARATKFDMMMLNARKKNALKQEPVSG